MNNFKISSAFALFKIPTQCTVPAHLQEYATIASQCLICLIRIFGTALFPANELSLYAICKRSLQQRLSISRRSPYASWKNLSGHISRVSPPPWEEARYLWEEEILTTQLRKIWRSEVLYVSVIVLLCFAFAFVLFTTFFVSTLNF